jgi:hypothetical protein
LVLAVGHSTRPIENFIRCYKRTVWRVCDRCAGIPAENILAF